MYKSLHNTYKTRIWLPESHAKQNPQSRCTRVLTDQQHLIFVGTELVDGPTVSELLYAESPPALGLLPEVPPQGVSPQLFTQKYNREKVTCPNILMGRQGSEAFKLLKDNTQ